MQSNPVISDQQNIITLHMEFEKVVFRRNQSSTKHGTYARTQTSRSPFAMVLSKVVVIILSSIATANGVNL